MNELRSREKKKLFATLLQEGVTALHLDPRRPGVIVPGRFSDQGWLVLNYSYRYNVADFRFNDQVIEASLSFGGQSFYCRVPWPAVFAITDSSRQRGRIWHDEVPADVDSAIGGGEAKPPVARGGPRRDPTRPTAVRAGPTLAGVPDGKSTAKPKVGRHGGLRLIVGGQDDPPEPAAQPDEAAFCPAPVASQAGDTDQPPPPRTRPQLRRIK